MTIGGLAYARIKSAIFCYELRLGPVGLKNTKWKKTKLYSERDANKEYFYLVKLVSMTTYQVCSSFDCDFWSTSGTLFSIDMRLEFENYLVINKIFRSLLFATLLWFPIVR
jgi:hypothetical protein